VFRGHMLEKRGPAPLSPPRTESSPPVQEHDAAAPAASADSRKARLGAWRPFSLDLRPAAVLARRVVTERTARRLAVVSVAAFVALCLPVLGDFSWRHVD